MANITFDSRNDRIFVHAFNKGWSDSTNDIRHIYDNGKNYLITFNNDRQYPIKYENAKILKNCVKVDSIDPFLFGCFFKINEAYLYKCSDGYYVLNNHSGISSKSEYDIKRYYKYAEGQQSLFMYYYSLAKLYDKETHSDFLASQYEKIKSLWNKTDIVLYSILNRKIMPVYFKGGIYPFSHNLSQIQAVEKALSNNVSVIQGPPGTGKTQTILNLIANILLRNKTVAIISNNNMAVDNVYQKLQEEGYGFLCANLGNLENRESFFSQAHENVHLPEGNFSDDYKEYFELEKKAFEYESTLSGLYDKKENLEKEYLKYSDGKNLDTISVKKSFSSNDILTLSASLEANGKEKLGFFAKLKLKFKYGIKKNYLNNIPLLTEYLNNTYIEKRIEDLNENINQAVYTIDKYNKGNYSSLVKSISKIRLNRIINSRLSSVSGVEYSMETFKTQFDSFITRYPIILSSTYCLPTSVPHNFSFDYIIIDEASQSTITTVLPSLAKGRNLVIIGDDKQLPPVISNLNKKYEQGIFANNKVSNLMRDDDKSFLKFVQMSIKSIPITLLKEHYRCPKQIIGFSNTRFYDSQLEIKKNEDGIDHLAIIKTVPGNHARKNDNGSSGQYNQREIDEIIELVKTLPVDKTIGVITPYRRQAELLREALPKSVEVGTIHTFQGREQQIIILSTVVNNADDYKIDEETIKSFVNNEQLINVAVTRAKEKFVLVTSDKIANSEHGILADLVKYICYETNIEIKEGCIKSVFDLLYNDYSIARKSVIQSEEILSEELIKGLVEEVLKDEKYGSLSYSTHVNLKSIVDINDDLYDNEENRYLHHPWTHLDFVIFNKFDKKPILAIEVDGVSYHEQNNKQSIHDSIKNKCLENSKLKLIRLKTNESNEHSRLCNALDAVLFG